ncbi:MAG: hypothetical protein LAO24_13110 [Acidobacteriia bacterium]|nr:hypothetical protein [Terriglobia bacterium]
MSVKRANYFKHQFLREQDFKEEQAYHVEMRRRHNRLFHSWGIADGLEVSKKGDRELIVEPGTALDKDGREIVLASPFTLQVPAFDASSHTYVTIEYRELFEHSDLETVGGVEGYLRVTELPEIKLRRHHPTQDGAVVALARVHLDEFSNIHHVDHSVRRRAGTASAAAGWVRLAFKPVRMELIRIDRKLVQPADAERRLEAEFTCDVAHAYCGERGARGSMQIPVPPGAERVTAFRISGTTRGNVRVQLVRTGWNASENRGEQTELLSESVRDASFHKELRVADHLQQLHGENHALAIAVVADAETDIWLVACHFE